MPVAHVVDVEVLDPLAEFLASAQEPGSDRIPGDTSGFYSASGALLPVDADADGEPVFGAPVVEERAPVVEKAEQVPVGEPKGALRTAKPVKSEPAGDEPVAKRRGRPRIHPIKDPDAPKRPRGRPPLPRKEG